MTKTRESKPAKVAIQPPHTLTPWQNDATKKYYGKHVIRHNGLVIAIICHGDGVDDAEAEANARLIVAAPRLLSALTAIRAAIEDAHENIHQIADAALSEAALSEAALSEVTR